MLTVKSLLAVSWVTSTRFDGPVEEPIDIVFASHKGQPGYNAFKGKLLDAYQRYLEYQPTSFKAMAISADIGGGFVQA